MPVAGRPSRPATTPPPPRTHPAKGASVVPRASKPRLNGVTSRHRNAPMSISTAPLIPADYGATFSEMKDDELYAHTPPKHRPKDEGQLLWEHLKGVAALAEEFAGAFGMAETGRLLGMTHDLGKASAEFQAYLRRGVRGGGPGHSDPGATAAGHLLEELIPVVQGHHGGLPDQGDSRARDENAVEAHVEAAEVLSVALGIDGGKPFETPLEGREREPLLRMLLSCLVDADRLDTEAYDQGRPREVRTESIEWYRAKLDGELEKYRDAEGAVNEVRRSVGEDCRQAAALPPGFFRLTVPTGGGKTLASLDLRARTRQALWSEAGRGGGSLYDGGRADRQDLRGRLRGGERAGASRRLCRGGGAEAGIARSRGADETPVGDGELGPPAGGDDERATPGLAALTAHVEGAESPPPRKVGDRARRGADPSRRASPGPLRRPGLACAPRGRDGRALHRDPAGLRRDPGRAGGVAERAGDRGRSGAALRRARPGPVHPHRAEKPRRDRGGTF